MVIKKKEVTLGRTEYNEYDFGTHEKMDAWADEKLGEKWVARVNTPGTKAGTGRFHHHKYQGQPIIEDTRLGKLYLKKGGRYP